jgi:putative ABC transport system substrate-binding protein
MKRREFIAALGGAAAWPLTARAQQRAMPMIAVLTDGELTPGPKAAFLRGLAETGYIEGRNVAIEYTGRGADPAHLRKLADDLVDRRVSVIATPGSTLAALAAKAATSTIPIVFGVGLDPVESGLVASLNRPGANITGYTEMQADVVSKRLELLHMLAPAAERFDVLIDPRNPALEGVVAREARAAAKAIGKQIEIIPMDDDAAFEGFFSNLPPGRIGAVLLTPGPFFFNRRNRVIELAASHRVPVAYWLREFPEAGGLMSYGASIEEMHRQVGNYAGRILKGTKPADLPVVRATRFEFVINGRTAKALGIEVPTTLSTIADEIIE